MRVAVFGTGGVGGYFGGRLAEAGEEVVFIARGAHLQAIREHGLHVESVKGDFVIHPAQATDNPAEVGVVDIVIVGVKAWQVTEAAQAMRPLVGPDSVVVPLQNGVEAPAQLAAVLGPECVVGGLAKIFGFIVGPGHIRHIGGPASIAFGELDNRPSTRLTQLREVFGRAGITAEISPDIHVALWEKFLFVVPLGGIGAVTRAPIGILRQLPETRQMLEQGMREILNVARARDIRLADDVIDRTMAFVNSQPADGTTSLQRDISAGRRSELEAWNGAVVRLGQQVGVATPLHTFLYHSLLPLELRAQGKVKFSIDTGS
jgi:2-dehydropantoate 2-reductase